MTDVAIAIGILGATMAWVHSKHMKKVGKYSESGAYEGQTPFRHDVLKTLTINVATFLIMTYLLRKTTGDALFDASGNFFDSILGKTVIDVVALFVYYHVLEPYVFTGL